MSVKIEKDWSQFSLISVAVHIVLTMHVKSILLLFHHSENQNLFMYSKYIFDTIEK